MTAAISLLLINSNCYKNYKPLAAAASRRKKPKLKHEKKNKAKRNAKKSDNYVYQKCRSPSNNNTERDRKMLSAVTNRCRKVLILNGHCYWPSSSVFACIQIPLRYPFPPSAASIHSSFFFLIIIFVFCIFTVMCLGCDIFFLCLVPSWHDQYVSVTGRPHWYFPPGRVFLFHFSTHRFECEKGEN